MLEEKLQTAQSQAYIAQKTFMLPERKGGELVQVKEGYMWKKQMSAACLH